MESGVFPADKTRIECMELYKTPKSCMCLTSRFMYEKKKKCTTGCKHNESQIAMKPDLKEHSSMKVRSSLDQADWNNTAPQSHFDIADMGDVHQLVDLVWCEGTTHPLTHHPNEKEQTY